LPIDFQIVVIERLPFDDGSFDAVLSTLMMHHLPDDLKRLGLAEIARVLKPGGPLVIANAEHPHLHPLALIGTWSRRPPLRSIDSWTKLAWSPGEVRQIQVTRLPVIPPAPVSLAVKPAMDNY
jgi:SAM-dependent methyltransferase